MINKGSVLAERVWGYFMDTEKVREERRYTTEKSRRGTLDREKHILWRIEIKNRQYQNSINVFMKYYLDPIKENKPGGRTYLNKEDRSYNADETL
jgi:hypothetical protein